jgi:hypothetical protein
MGRNVFDIPGRPAMTPLGGGNLRYPQAMRRAASASLRDSNHHQPNEQNA